VGSVLSRDELLQANPSMEDVIEFIHDDLPLIDDTIKDETDLIHYNFEDETFNASAKLLMSKYTQIISTKLRSEPAKVEPMVLDLDLTRWQVNANRTPPRVVSKEKESVMIKQIQEHLDQNIIKPSTSPYWSQVLMVPKPPSEDGSKRWRFCCDLRNLNSCTKTEGGFIPHIKNMIQRIGNKRPKYFVKIDLLNGFFQAPVSKSSTQHLAFTSSIGNYEFQRVPMGCKNAPMYFQNQLANTVLPGLLYNIAELYIDDLLIMAETQEELLINLEKVLQRFLKHNIIINPSKCWIGMSQVEYVGYTIDDLIMADKAGATPILVLTGKGKKTQEKLQNHIYKMLLPKVRVYETLMKFAESL
jgi:hypothetical protein